MLISKIGLSNFKNFDEAQIELGNLNIIVGANASGKSNFIQSIKFIRDIEEYGLENAISLQGGIDYLRNIKLKDKKNVKICMEIKPPGGVILKRFTDEHFLGMAIDKLKYTLELSLKSRSRYEVFREEIEYDTRLEEVLIKEDREISFGNYNYKVHTLRRKLAYSEEIPKEFSKFTLSNGEVYDVLKEKKAPFVVPYVFFKTEYDAKKTLLEQFSFLVPRSIDEVKIYDFDLKNSKKPASITSKAELEENGENLAIVLKGILNDKDTRRKFSNLISDVLPFIYTVDIKKSQDNSLFFRVKEIFNSETAIPSSLLSDGTISITSVLTALFFEESKLDVYEEPERGIHPSLISKLMEMFYDASKNKQIIITTHSPEILKHTNLEDLFLVTRNSEGFTSIDKPNDHFMVKSFLQSELGIDQLFIQNLLSR